MTEQRMMEQRMTEQNGHEERERNNARDGDAGFAALEATEPHFGSSALVTLFPLSLLPRRLR